MKKKRGLKIKLSNRWLYTFIVLGILAIVAVGVYAWPASGAGHNGNEINVDNTLCNAVTGHNCGYDSSGSSLWSKSGSRIYYTSGNVGIGTSSPNYKLDVYVKDGWKARFYGDDGYIAIGPANSGWAHIYTDRDAFIFNTPVYSYVNTFSSYNGDLLLQTKGTTRMTISTSGNVNIGGALQVGGSTTYNSGCSYGEYGTIKKCSPGYHLCSCSGDNYNALRWMRLD